MSAVSVIDQVLPEDPLGDYVCE